eukprot:6503434-Prorocentrum_lima.AAC.1
MQDRLNDTCVGTPINVRSNRDYYRTQGCGHGEREKKWVSQTANPIDFNVVTDKFSSLQPR